MSMPRWISEATPRRDAHTYIFPRSGTDALNHEPPSPDHDHASFLDFISEDRDPPRPSQASRFGVDGTGAMEAENQDRQRTEQMKMLDRASHQQEHSLRQEQEQASKQGSLHGPGRRPLHSRRSSRRREGDEMHKKEESMKAEEERRASLLHAIRSSNRMKAATLRNSVDAAGRQLPKDPDVMAREEAEARAKEAARKQHVRRENPDKAIIAAVQSVKRVVAERLVAKKIFMRSVRNANALSSVLASADTERNTECECSFCGALFLQELLIGPQCKCARCYIKTYGGCGCAQCELQQKRYVARELSQRAQAIQAAIPTQFPPSAALVASEGAEKDATASAASLMRKFPFDLSLQVQEDIAGKVQRDQQIRRATPAGRHIQDLNALDFMPLSSELWRLTEEQEVRAFFGRLDLGRFAAGIIRAGYDTMAAASELTPAVLHEEFGMSKPLAHRAFMELRKRKQEIDICPNHACSATGLSYERDRVYAPKGKGDACGFVARCTQCGWTEVSQIAGAQNFSKLPSSQARDTAVSAGRQARWQNKEETEEGED